MIDVPRPLNRVCIVMMSAVGDAVHVLPVINALKRHSPGVHITWVLQPGPATLVRGHRSVADIILFDRSAGMRGFADVRRTLSQRAFDLVIDLQVYFKAGIVTRFTRAPIKLGFFELVPVLGLSEQYDSNLYREAENQKDAWVQVTQQRTVSRIGA